MDLKSAIILPLLFCLAAIPAGAQRKVSADVEVKTVSGGKLSTVTKSVYCANNGRLVTIFKKPVSYYVVANAKGEAQLYRPASNEVFTQTDKSLASGTELVMLFMGGQIDDLGLRAFGYKLTATTRDDGYVKKTFKPSDPTLPDVEIVSENYLPIYCLYTAPDGKVLSKKYLSDYKQFGRLMLPLRVTDIAYGKGNDSTVVRTIYSSVKVDVDDPAFAFQVPADATPMKLPEAAR